MSNTPNKREPLTEEQANDLGISAEYFSSVKKLEEYIRTTKKSQVAVAKELGISEGYVSTFLGGQYKSQDSLNKLIANIDELIEKNNIKKGNHERPPFKMTSTSQQVTNMIKNCDLCGEIGLIYGDPGVGKTMACKNYENTNHNAVLLEIPYELTVSAMNRFLCKKLNLRNVKAQDAFESIVNALNGTHKVIIIDEAQLLPIETINYLRRIYDKCDYTIGMAFVGNEEIMHKIGDMKYQQIRGRMYGGGIEQIKSTDIKMSDIELVFKDMDLSKDALKVLYKISQISWNSLRVAASVFVRTARQFEVDNYSEVTAARLTQVTEEMKAMPKREIV